MKMLTRLTRLIADVETGNDDDASHSFVNHNFHYDVHELSVIQKENVNLLVEGVIVLRQFLSIFVLCSLLNL